ncbi:RICIN domain-containing protein [Streptomyces pakalii]|uniref:RICIN domain-containing protein n=1 Tax=Streptomyces pakalii TaxID=3036494 RepID=A0ABT7DHY9_9ACTN|nr:RICIN domain-containing protein [Streptomyces pakalii]MDJ1645432.1 RICIN domain-containing protein [Streptomyces pakalii]
MRLHFIPRAALALMGATGLLAGGSAASSAQQLPQESPTAAVSAPADTRPIQTFANMATGSCLDDSYEFGLRGFGCNGGPWQQWRVRVWSEDATRQLENVATKECLYDDGVTLDTRRCDSSRQQSWFAHKNGDRVVFENQATGECLDDSEYGLRTIVCSHNTHQKWR